MNKNVNMGASVGMYLLEHRYMEFIREEKTKLFLKNIHFLTEKEDEELYEMLSSKDIYDNIMAVKYILEQDFSERVKIEHLGKSKIKKIEWNTISMAISEIVKKENINE